jgi:hypothetical protein
MFFIWLLNSIILKNKKITNKIKKGSLYFFFAENSSSEIDRLFVKFSRSYTIRNTHTQTSRRTPLNEWSPRSYLHNTKQTHGTNIHILVGFRTRNPKNRKVTELCLNIARLPGSTKNLLINFTFMLPRIVIDLFLNNQPDALIIPILFCYKTLHVSGIFSAHHQEFSTLHSTLVSFMQVSEDRFKAESGWNSVPSWLC